MNDVERALRDTLADPRRELEPWLDPASRVRRAARAQRGRRLSLVTGVALLALLVPAALLVAEDGRAPDAGNVPMAGITAEVRRIPLDIDVDDIATTRGTTRDVWVVGERTLLRIRATDGSVAWRVTMPEQAREIVVGYGSVYALEEGRESIDRSSLMEFDTETGDFEGVIELPYAGQHLALGNSAIWVTTPTALLEVDPDRHAMESNSALPPGHENFVVANDVGVWVVQDQVAPSGSRVLRVDPATALIEGERSYPDAIGTAASTYGWGDALMVTFTGDAGIRPTLLDGRTLQPRAAFDLVGASALSVAAATAHRAWLLDPDEAGVGGAITQSDRAPFTQQGTSAIDGGLRIAVAENNIWLAEARGLIHHRASDPEPGSLEAQPPPTGPGMEIGREYPYELYTHCGIEFARLDGRVFRTDPIDDGSHNPPRDWGNPMQRGVITLTGADTAVFRDTLGHQLTFRADPRADPPPCD